MANLDGHAEISQAFLKKSYEPAQSFFQIFYTQVVPAVKIGNIAEIQTSMTALDGAYEAHRKAIDETVVLSEKWRQEVTKKVEDEASTNNIMMIVLVIASISIGVVISVLISTSLVKSVKYANDVLKRISEGDLTTKIDEKFITRDEIGQLCLSTKQTAENLNRILSTVTSSAKQVNESAMLISDSAQSLAQGVSEQASSVEELAATVTQITKKVQDNASNASKARELTAATSEEVARGSDQMNQMMKAMMEINTSSGEISKIIKIIDEIAFQTNILALNAAVEAARSGNAGRGFTVVAEEVKNLANRSADAAKTTTAYIESSVKKTVEGMKIAEGTTQSLSEIVAMVQGINGLVSDIDTASSEQATALKQVSSGIQQISWVVQMNSSKAEESASGSEELLSQAGFMKQQVAQFKIKAIEPKANAYAVDNSIDKNTLNLNAAV